MTTQRIKCTECENMILPATAARNNGLCTQCVKIPKKIREETRNELQRIEDGNIFPSTADIQAGLITNKILLSDTRWLLEPDYYNETPNLSIENVIESAKQSDTGQIYLISNEGSRINLTFNSVYGVCDFQDKEEQYLLYAHSNENSTVQIDKDFHLIQGCPCCGVGMFYFSSCSHMPRNTAFSIYETITVKNEFNINNVFWLDIGDISYNSPGKG